MRACVRCGTQMEEGFQLLVSVGTVATSMSTDGMSVGSGEGELTLSRRVPTGETGLPARPKMRVESRGAARAAVCPHCGEVSLYTE